MRGSWTARVGLALLGATLAAAPARADAERTLEESWPYRDGQAIHFEFPVGEVRIEGAPGDEVKLSIVAECKWGVRRCESLLEELRVDTRSSDRRLRIKVVGGKIWGQARLEVEARLTVPARAPLEVEMGVGELDIRGLEADVDAELGVGELRLRMARARVGSVELDAGIGEAELSGAGERISGRRSMLVGSEVEWTLGSGAAQLDLEVGVGEISVRLEE